MRALTLVADRKLELIDVPEPPPPATGEVQISIKAIGLNHLDVWGWRGMAFAKRKLHLGYREARLRADSSIGPAQAIVRGHEFHYATLMDAGSDEPLVELADAQGRSVGTAGGRRGFVTGTFFHAIARKEME